MFQLKNFGIGSQGSENIPDQDPTAGLVNTFGKVRTLKEDYEKSISGNKNAVDVDPITSTSGTPEPNAAPFQMSKAPSGPQFEPPQPLIASSELKPFGPTEPINPPAPSKPSGDEPIDNKPAGSNYLNSQSFFEDKSPFAEDVPLEQKIDETQSNRTNINGKLIAIGTIILIFVIIGAGVYWYLFRKSSPQETTTTELETIPISNPETETNQNIKLLTLSDPLNKTGIISSIKTLSQELKSESGTNQVHEVKLLNNNNEAIPTQDFIDGVGLIIPVEIKSKLSNEYSLFIYNNQDVKIGIAFKINDATNLSQLMRNWEATLPSNIAPLYLDTTPIPTSPAFNTSKYKSADIRYFNFSSTTANTVTANPSLDYAIISDKSATYLLISSSKDSMRSILDYMTTN